jgi:enoyl-CoA hydratase
MEYKNLLFEVKDNVALVQFNRPKALNAMNSETMGELIDAVKRCGEDENVRLSSLPAPATGPSWPGRHRGNADLTPAEALKFMERGHETYRAIEILPKPVIAAIKGFALGGGTEISMSCDMRFAADNARFGQPEILLGLIPGWGGTQRLTRLIGIGRAKEFIMGGEQISAQRAYELAW